MNKTEIRKIVEKDLLDFFDAKTLLSNNQILMELCIDSTLKAINYSQCCETVKDKYTHTFEVDLNSDKLKEQHCEQMKQIHSAPTRLFMYDPKTEEYIELKP